MIAPTGEHTALRQGAVGLVVEQLRRAVPGGIGTYARGLLAGLAALGEEASPAVTLVASRRRATPDPLTALGRPVEALALPGPLLTRAWAIGAMGLSGYRLVHTTSLDVPPTDSPLVVAVHDLLWREFPDAYGRHGRNWHEAALRRAARRAAAFVVPTELARAALAEVLGRSDRREIAVIGYGADNLASPDPRGAAELLASLGVTGSYLLTVGTLEPRKNLARVIAAYASAREQMAGHPSLVICGPTGWGAALPSGAPPEGVVLAGRVEDAVLSALYAGALALAYVSLGEGFGLPIVEAMAAGIPVVASAVPAAGDAALLVDPSDTDAIAAALVQVASDEPTRAALVEAGHRRAAAYTWRRAAAAHVALWDALAPSE